MKDYVILPCHEGTKDFHFKVYSADLKTFYGNCLTFVQAMHQVDVLRSQKLKGGAI